MWILGFKGLTGLPLVSKKTVVVDLCREIERLTSSVLIHCQSKSGWQVQNEQNELTHSLLEILPKNAF